MLKTLRFIWTHPIAKRSRCAAFSRYIRWQLGARILGWPAVVPFVDGAKLVVERGMHGATGNVFCGLHEFVDMAFLLHYLRPEDLFVDVGANIGSYTVLASAVVGAATVSVEPIAETFSLFQQNVRLNNIGHLVSAHCCAAGVREETRQMNSNCGSRSRFVSSEFAGQAVEVAVRPLDSLINCQPTSLWKIDVEGSELEVLEGATQAIDATTLQAVILEADNEPIARFMRARGFERAAYDPFTRQLSALACGRATPNQLWLRDREAVAARCEAGRRYQILWATV